MQKPSNRLRVHLTRDDGSFQIKATTGKPYTLALIFVGYINKVTLITGADPNVALGKLMMKQSNSQLKQVDIVAAKPLMTQEVDRLSYNVAADPESKSVSALDMMRKVPLLTVDASDNIQLKGSSNYKNLVNGKESALLAKNPSDVLRSMPGTNIVKIEVITTPPAKYDAEGLAGIINIITTKNIDEGYNIGINTRYNSIWGPGVNLNSTVKEGKFGFSGYAGIGRQNKAYNPYNNKESFLDSAKAVTSVLDQAGTSSYSGNYKYFDGEFSYAIDSLNLITASIDYNLGVNDEEDNGFTTQGLNNVYSQRYNEDILSNSSYTGIDAGINYQLGFKKSKDQLLTLSYRYDYSPNTSNTSDTFTDTLGYVQPNYRQYNNAGNRTQTVQVDYAQPFKKFSLEAGGKAIFRNNFSDFSEDTLATNSQYQLNPAETNDFNYRQDVYSLYNSYQVKLDKWTGKAGLRLEETTINADFASEDQPLNTNYSNLIPSVSIQRTLTTTSNMNFGFTERIQRPDISELNPFIDNSNPLFVNQGNPDLKPELNHVFELNYSRFSTGSINAGVSYSFSNNSIQNVSSIKTQKVNGQADSVTYTTYENLGSNSSLGLNLNVNYPLTKKLSLNINGQLSRIWLTGEYNGEMYKNSGFLGNMFTSLAYKFDSGYRIGVNTGYFSGNVNLQGRSSYFIFNSYVFSKDFLDKKASISLVTNNPWARYWHGSSTTTTPDFIQDNTHDQTYRTFAVRVSYRFGKLNSDIKKNEHGIDNDDTKSGTKSTGNQ